MISKSMDFEYWIRFTLPKQLHLSESRQAAMGSVLYHFADFIRPLERKAPEEFKYFFSELKKLIKKAGKERCPKGWFVYDGRYCERLKTKS